MQKIPVTRDGRRGSEILLLNAQDVVKIDKIKEREYIIHTMDNQYYLDFSLDAIEEWLFEDGFRLLDSNNIVNMNQIREYDHRKGIIYFGDRTDKLVKTASAARIHKEHIENVLHMLHQARILSEKGENAEYPAPSSNVGDDRFLRSYETIRAVNEKKWAEAKIVHMAYHDSLTRLPNRLMFHEKLNQSFQEAERTGQKMAILFLDLDRIKLINDTLGHYVGDKLLQFWGGRLKTMVRDEDIIARFSGDEFVILLTEIRHVDEVTRFAKEIFRMLEEPFVYEEHELFVTASIGISLYPQDGTDADTLIKHADTAMYRAKEKGGNTYQLYHADMHFRSMERLNLEIQLRKAMDRNEITVYYQPLLDLKTGRIFGMESLVRWQHPTMGMVSPGEFIPLAEETGLIVPIGNYVLRQACRQNKLWTDMGLGPLVVAVNVSVHQFQQPGFVQTVREVLQETGLAPRQLCLEITENVAMKNVSYIITAMEKLKQLGVQISIDDFGTGYSSLNYLKKFQVHTLKIDRSFIKDVTTDEDNAVIVKALIAMSRQLKLKTLAEGVETREQVTFLREQGCDEIQGFVFSRPLPDTEFENIVKERRGLYEI